MLWFLLAACGTPPEPPSAEALAIQAVAAAGKTGWVRCDVAGQDDIPESGVRVADEYATLQGKAVWFTAPSESGTMQLTAPHPPTPERTAGDEIIRAFLEARQEADKPWAVARWTGATDGQPGTCRIADPKPIKVKGTLEGGHMTGMVHGCGGAFKVMKGEFEVQTTDGEPCGLRHDRASEDLVVLLERDPAPATITVPPDTFDGTAAQRIDDQVRRAGDAVAEAQERLDILARAAQAVEGDAAIVVQEWTRGAQLQHAAAANALQNVQRFQSALQDAHETYGQAPAKP